MTWQPIETDDEQAKYREQQERYLDKFYGPCGGLVVLPNPPKEDK